MLPVGQLADIANAGTLYAFFMVALAVMLLRKRDPDRPRKFRVPALWLIGPLTMVGCRRPLSAAAAAGDPRPADLGGDRLRHLLRLFPPERAISAAASSRSTSPRSTTSSRPFRASTKRGDDRGSPWLTGKGGFGLPFSLPPPGAMTHGRMPPFALEGLDHVVLLGRRHGRRPRLLLRRDRLHRRKRPARIWHARAARRRRAHRPRRHRRRARRLGPSAGRRRPQHGPCLHRHRTLGRAGDARPSRRPRRRDHRGRDSRRRPRREPVLLRHAIRPAT